MTIDLETPQRRKLITRAFIETGEDGVESLILYIDKLENAILELERRLREITDPPEWPHKRVKKSRRDLYRIIREYDI